MNRNFSRFNTFVSNETVTKMGDTCNRTRSLSATCSHNVNKQKERRPQNVPTENYMNNAEELIKLTQNNSTLHSKFNPKPKPKFKSRAWDPRFRRPRSPVSKTQSANALDNSQTVKLENKDMKPLSASTTVFQTHSLSNGNENNNTTSKLEKKPKQLKPKPEIIVVKEGLNCTKVKKDSTLQKEISIEEPKIKEDINTKNGCDTQRKINENASQTESQLIEKQAEPKNIPHFQRCLTFPVFPTKAITDTLCCHQCLVSKQKATYPNIVEGSEHDSKLSVFSVNNNTSIKTKIIQIVITNMQGAQLVCGIISGILLSTMIVYFLLNYSPMISVIEQLRRIFMKKKIQSNHQWSIQKLFDTFLYGLKMVFAKIAEVLLVKREEVFHQNHNETAAWLFRGS